MIKIFPNNFIDNLRRGVFNCFRGLVGPLSEKEDDRRHELILNIILFSSILLLAILDLVVLYNTIRLGPDYQGVSFFVFSAILASFVFLYVLSRHGKFYLASYALTAIYFASITYAALRWGADLQIVILSYVLLISVASILVSTYYGFLVTLLVSGTVLGLAYLQSENILTTDSSWRNNSINLEDAIPLVGMYFLLMVVFWLSNREIERSLQRAHRSEAELLVERDLLEVKVEERTTELKQLQMEKMSQLYRFAEFGRLATGIFHDLVNPLTALSLHMGKIKGGEPDNLESSNYHLEKAIGVTKRMESLIQALRHQTAHGQERGILTINDEISEAIDLLAFKSRKAGVKVDFIENETVLVAGSAVKFHQVIVNLISNAIDAYDELNHPSPLVVVSLESMNNRIVITVKDSGVGIPAEYVDKVYDPFFTTKVQGRGTGIGLTLARDIVTKEFGGTLEFVSNENEGTLFIITLPPDSSLT